jgi:hypothetical protein
MSNIIYNDLYFCTAWLEEKRRHGIWWEGVTAALFRDTGLLFLFGLQHSGMASRVLGHTSFWTTLHHKYGLDRPLYLLATGIALQVNKIVF